MRPNITTYIHIYIYLYVRLYKSYIHLFPQENTITRSRHWSSADALGCSKWNSKWKIAVPQCLETPTAGIELCEDQP